MSLHNNLRWFFLLHSLLIPLNLARSEISPSPDPHSFPQFGHISSPSQAPAYSFPTPSTSPSPVLSPSSGPTSGPSPSSGPAEGPSPSSSGPARGPSSSSGPTPGPAAGPSSDDSTEADGLFQFDFSPSLSPSADVDPKVKQICDYTDYPSLCLATVAPSLNGKADVASVLDVTIRAGAKLSRYGLLLAQKLADEPGTQPVLASIINDCKESYSTAVENYDIAIEAIPEDDIGTIKIRLSAVITYIGDCEDALSKKGKDMPFYSIAPRLRNMTSNCLALVDLLE